MAAPSQHVLGIDPKMYRHFAALTLVISLSTAFFANGLQNREVSSGSAVKAAKPDVKGHAPRSEMDVLNGTPPDPAPAMAGGSPPPPPSIAEGPIDPVASDDGQFSPRAGHFNYRRPPLRVDPALLAKMTPAQRAGYLKALALQDQAAQSNQDGGGGAGAGGPGSTGPGGPSQPQIDRLVSASRARSGGGD